MTTGADVPAELVAALERMGVAPAAITAATPLTGGVSSDIWRIATEDRTWCVKRALPVLKTAERWEAPIERSASEARWLAEAARVDPSAVPGLVAFDRQAGALLLEWLDTATFANWKSELLHGRVEIAVAGRLGRMLRALHDAFATPTQHTAFDNAHLFHALRLEPYLARTAARHPDLAEDLHELVVMFTAAAATVVHGDVSPKNVLVSDDRVVILDAECATWGDAAFDVAFCLTHLCAKGLHIAPVRTAIHRSAVAFVDGYADGRADASTAMRAARWLPALLLARVDGASPLEYLDEAERGAIRAATRGLLADPSGDVGEAVARWFAILDTHAASPSSHRPQ